MSSGFFSQVQRLVCLIPRGQVATYGQLASILGHPRAARTIGWALHGLTAEQARVVPWQRVVGAGGRISTAGQHDWTDLQRRLLRQEGVQFDQRGRIDMARFQWQGPDLVQLEEILGGETETGGDRSTVDQ